MSTYCDEFRECTTCVRDWLVKQPSVKEESLTDWLLFQLSERLPNIAYRAFTRHEEARHTGADWEWWFLFGDGFVRMRIQAKKLNSTADNYPGLARTNAYGLQIDKLILDSRNANAVPLYALFTASASKSLCPQPVLDAGAYLAGAHRLRKSFIQTRRVASEAELLRRSTPLSCLACCPLCRGGSAAGLLEHLQRYHLRLDPAGASGDDGTPLGELPLDSGDDRDQGPNTLGLHSELPSYVTSLLQHREQLPEWWEREFAHQVRDFNALLVTDMRA